MALCMISSMALLRVTPTPAVTLALALAPFIVSPRLGEEPEVVAYDFTSDDDDDDDKKKKKKKEKKKVMMMMMMTMRVSSAAIRFDSSNQRRLMAPAVFPKSRLIDFLSEKIFWVFVRFKTFFFLSPKSKQF